MGQAVRCGGDSNLSPSVPKAKDPPSEVAQLARADPIESRVECEARPAANNPGLRAVLRRHAPSATRQRTLEANGIDCGAGPVYERSSYAASGTARARLSGRRAWRGSSSRLEDLGSPCPCTSTAARTARPSSSSSGSPRTAWPGARRPGRSVERVLQPFTPRYKGTGFYSTDHRKPKAKEPPKGGDGK